MKTDLIGRLRTHVHAKGLGYASPYRMGIAAGELDLDVDPWYPTEQSRFSFLEGVEVGKKRRTTSETSNAE
jgi:hypothetical protein